MKLSSILNPDLIFHDVTGGSREEVYRNILGQAAGEVDMEFDVAEVAEGIIAREDAVNIPWENGAALPHLRSSGFDDLYVIIGILKEPLRFKDADREPIKIVILSLIAENTSELYLKSLSAFSRYFIKKENVEKLAGTGSAYELLETLDNDGVMIKKSLTAEDVMDNQFVWINGDAKIKKALDMFVREGRIQLPVLDKDMKLMGVLDASALIRNSIPKHIMMMDNLKFMTGFDAVEKLLSHEEELVVKDFVRQPRQVVHPDTPLIQLTVILAKEEARNIFIVDKENHMIGIITLQDIIQKALRV